MHLKASLLATSISSLLMANIVLGQMLYYQPRSEGWNSVRDITMKKQKRQVNTPSSSTVTVTVTVAAATSTPTSTYNCATSGCSNYGTCSGSGTCICPPGFGGDDCLTPTCGGLNQNPSSRPLKSNNTACSCDSGFGGINCNICTSSNVCSTQSSSTSNGVSLLTTGNNPTCSQSSRAYVASFGDCKVINPTLQGLYPLTSRIVYNRNVSTATLDAQLWYNNVEQFYCKASNCTQIVGSTVDYHCTTTQCKCLANTTLCGDGPGSVIALGSSINAISGTLDLDCNLSSNDGKCNFKSSSLTGLFPAGLSLEQCIFGECVDQSIIDADTSGVYGSSSGGIPAGVIAGLVILGVFLIAFISLFALAFIKRQFRRHKESAIGYQGVDLEFRDISYKARLHGGIFGRHIGDRSLLNSVSGSVGKGQIMAILGPSGAGKTTLLDILAGKNKSGKISGSIYVDQKIMKPYELKKIVGFVDQEDLLPATQTIREALTFAAKLKLPESLPLTEKKKRVEEVMELLGLTHIADQRIGSIETRGISGGEKRRLSIGLEILASPAILILDEPTSGLDSVSAKNVIEQLKSLSRSEYKTTIVMTIHQPRADVYAMLDVTILLSNGTELYSGKSHEAKSYFDEKGYKCPEYYNIADHLLDIASTEGISSHTISLVRNSSVRSIKSTRRETGSNNMNDDEKRTISSPKDISNDPLKSSNLKQTDTNIRSHTYAASFLTQLEALSGREWRNLLRNRSLFVAHFSTACILGVIVGGLYFKTNLTLAGFQNRLGGLFFMLALIGISSLSALGNFSAKRGLFIRERSNHFYSAPPFVLAHLLFDLVPLRLLPSLILSTIIYWMVGLANTAGQFFKFWLVIVLFQFSTALFCMNIAAIFAETSVASLVASIVMLFALVFGGFILNLQQITPVLSWIQYLSPFKYALEALSVNEVVNLPIVDTLQGVNINVPASLILQKLFGFQDHFSEDVLILFAFVIGFIIMLIGVIEFLLRERK